MDGRSIGPLVVTFPEGADAPEVEVKGDAGNPIPVTPATVATAAPTQVASSASSVTLAALNTARKGLWVFNDSTAALFIKLGATASATSFNVKVAAGALWECPPPVYTGRVDGIWSAVNGNAYVTEPA